MNISTLPVEKHARELFINHKFDDARACFEKICKYKPQDYESCKITVYSSLAALSSNNLFCTRRIN